VKCQLCKRNIRAKEHKFYFPYFTDSNPLKAKRAYWCEDCDRDRAEDVEAMLEELEQKEAGVCV